MIVLRFFEEALWNIEDFEVDINDRNCFFVLVSETLTFLGASVMIGW